MLASDGEAISGLWFEGQKYFPGSLVRRAPQRPLPIFDEAICWLDIYFSGRQPDFTPKLGLYGTPFRNIVWDILLTIPYGRTTTYGEIARTAAHKLGLAHMSAQAVGGAVGHNPISLMVPCHRVIGADGSLTGYAGGLEKKLCLLRLEGADTSPFHLP